MVLNDSGGFPAEIVSEVVSCRYIVRTVLVDFAVCDWLFCFLALILPIFCAHQSLIVPYFTNSVFGSSCNYLFFCLNFASFLSLCNFKTGNRYSEQVNTNKREWGITRDNCMNCHSWIWCIVVCRTPTCSPSCPRCLSTCGSTSWPPTWLSPSYSTPSPGTLLEYWSNDSVVCSSMWQNFRFDHFPPFDQTIRHIELCNSVVSHIQRNPPKLV